MHLVTDVNRWIADHRGDGHIVPRIPLPGGGWISVQASRFHYCRPRNDTGPYTRVEVLSPERIVELDAAGLSPEENGDAYLYAFAPVDTLNRALAHGTLSE